MHQWKIAEILIQTFIFQVDLGDTLVLYMDMKLTEDMAVVLN